MSVRFQQLLIHKITPQRVSERSPTPLKEGRFCGAKVLSGAYASMRIPNTLRGPPKKLINSIILTKTSIDELLRSQTAFRGCFSAQNKNQWLTSCEVTAAVTDRFSDRSAYTYDDVEPVFLEFIIIKKGLGNTS
jgi:hypothetical protein